jgi:hypothetical protein
MSVSGRRRREPVGVGTRSPRRGHRANSGRRRSRRISLRGGVGSRDTRWGCTLGRAVGTDPLRGRSSSDPDVRSGRLDRRSGPATRAAALPRPCSRLADRERSPRPDRSEGSLGAARHRSPRAESRKLAGRPGELRALRETRRAGDLGGRPAPPSPDPSLPARIRRIAPTAREHLTMCTRARRRLLLWPEPEPEPEVRGCNRCRLPNS